MSPSPRSPVDPPSGPVLVLSEESRARAEAASGPSPAMLEVLRRSRAVHLARTDERRAEGDAAAARARGLRLAAEEELGATLDRLSGTPAAP